MWVKRRHKVFYHILAPFIRLLCRLQYGGLRMEPFPDAGKRQYLVLYNHQTPFDQFFVSLVMRQPVYHIATEDIFSNGFVSSLIRRLVAPIPIKKQVSDLTAVRTCVRVAREGGTIAVAPEGNRTFSGRTVYINPAIAKLARMIRLPVAIMRIEGGYGIQPRWADNRRSGEGRAYIAEVIEPEEYLALDANAFFARIKEALTVDESGTGGTYRSARTAEHLERLFYVCPSCGFSRFVSEGRQVRCTKCGMAAVYTEEKELLGVGCDFPFSSIGEWYDYQTRYVLSADLSAYMDEPLRSDSVHAFRIVPGVSKTRLPEMRKVSLFADRIEVHGEGGETIRTFPFAETDVVTVLGRKKINIYAKGDVLQLKGGADINALMYMNIFYKFKNADGGTQDGQFLGL